MDNWLTAPVSDEERHVHDEAVRLGYLGDGLELYRQARELHTGQVRVLKDAVWVVALMLTLIAFLVLRWG